MKENRISERGHEYYMKFPIYLARTTRTRGDAPMCSAVIKDGVIIAVKR